MPAEVTAEGSASIRQAYKTDGPNGYWQALLAFTKKRAEVDPESAPPLAVLAALHVRAGDKERAFEYLERSFEEREVEILRLHDTLFDPVRSDPRFQDLVRRIGLPEHPVGK